LPEVKKLDWLKPVEFCDGNSYSASWRRGSENARLMNRYDCGLARDGQKWRFKRVTIDNGWTQGDPEISQRACNSSGVELKDRSRRNNSAHSYEN